MTVVQILLLTMPMWVVGLIVGGIKLAEWIERRARRRSRE